MLKTLIEKEFSAFFGRTFKAKNSKNASKTSPVLVVFLIATLFLLLSFSFFSLFAAIAPVAAEANASWIIGTFSITFATIFSLIGSVFATQSQLYDATDNDLLLSLPIPPAYILISRMLPLYVYNLFFVSVVALPALVAYAVFVSFNLLSVIFWLILIIVVSFVSLSICCLIGRLLAGFVKKFKNSSLTSIILSFAFFAIYFLLVSNAESVIKAIVTDISEIAAFCQKYLVTLYWTGLASTGKIGWFFLVLVFNVGFSAIVLYFLSKSYIKIVTGSRKVKKINTKKPLSFREKSQFTTLLNKEWQRFSSSSTYFVNCSMGSILLIIAVIAAIINAKTISDLSYVLEDYKRYFSTAVFLITTMLLFTNSAAASSVSMEGKSLWIIQSLPINAKTILLSKLILHFLISAPFSVFSAIVFGIIVKLDFLTVIFLAVSAASFVFLQGEFGLSRNLKHADFSWTNASVPVKQSGNVLAFLLFSLAAALVFGAILTLLNLILPSAISTLILAIMLFAFTFLYLKSLTKKGEFILKNL